MANTRKRIAVLVGQADECYQQRFITGLIKQSFEFDMDVCIFSMYRKYQDVENREKGEANIFSLMNTEKFDGVVFLKDTIQTSGAADTVEKRLHDDFNGPVIVIEKESEYFDSIYTDGYSSVKALVSHLIEVHGFKKIAFLGGKKWHIHSKQRLSAFRDAMKEHGLDVREDLIIHGDFWYNSGEQCADYLTSLDETLPEAVMCANDAMAIGLCDAFEKRGIKVPEDIAVISYDSTEEGQTSPKTITSANIPAMELGEYSAIYIKNKIDGKEVPEFTVIPKLLIGESCGCKETNMPPLTIRRDVWMTEVSEEGFNSVNNQMSEDLLKQTSLLDFISMVHAYAFQIRGAESFHLCLNSQWRYLDSGSDNQENGAKVLADKSKIDDSSMSAAANLHVKNEGYSDTMIHAIIYNSTRKDDQVSLTDTFSVKEMLPDLEDMRDAPRAYFFTPVFFEEECFGYAVVGYGSEIRSYDEVYRQWICAVSRGFENLRRNCVIQALTAQVDKIRVGKFDIGNAAYENLSEEEREEYRLTETILNENLLTYHFQPIVRTTDGSIYSYEALMRATTDKWISPLSIIKYANMQGRLSDVEKATFLNVLDKVDNNRTNFGNAKVFINSIPGVKLEGSDFDKTSMLLSKYSDVAVVELTEEAELSDTDLDELKEYFERINVETAVDDYGTGYSNVSNLLRYMPNYVKIDRSLLSEIHNKPQKQHFVREIIEFCHDNNIMALAEGVETSEELRMVIHLGADLIQGFYTAKPSPEIVPSIDKKIRNEIKAYYQEKMDGVDKNIYVAGKTNRVSLNTLVKDGCTDIVVGQEGMVYKDIAIIGTPSMKSEVHMRVESGYSGRIILENVYFSNVKNRPCIEISSGADVTLVLQGDNELHGSGIQVMEDSKFVLEGDGNLSIDLNAPGYFGIGNELNLKHGDIIFEQDGRVLIHTSGKDGICIGSGLGGNIEVNRGHYILKTNGDNCVGIGAMDGEVDLLLDACLIEIDLVATRGVSIGSMNNNTKVKINKSSIKCFGGGREIAVIGSFEGDNCDVEIVDSSAEINICTEYGTCIGAISGATRLDTKFVGLRLNSSGEKALAFGGFNDDVYLNIISTDTIVDVHNKINVETYAKEENIKLYNGRINFMVNDRGVERKLKFGKE